MCSRILFLKLLCLAFVIGILDLLHFMDVQTFDVQYSILIDLFTEKLCYFFHH
jgi:hypothetical protein